MKLKMVETEVFRIKPESYAEIFSGIKSGYWLFPSFTELFDKTFSAHLSFKAKSVKGDELRAAVNRSDYAFLSKHLKTNFNIEGEIADLVLLKMLYDAFFSGDFQKDAVQKLVALNRFTNHKNEIIKTTALNILEKFNHLQKGKEAPPICLQSIDGHKMCTNTNKQKFKYLVFADTEMIICREQLKQVSAIGKKFEKHLEIFVILKNTDRVEMKKFLSENKIGGIQLVDETNLFIREYNVKSFPQCFLLDENHNLEFVTTQAPLDGFEQQFGSFLQRELFERQRNQSR
jgi:translation initiation factor 2 beta subunit (eIF-2beta)/eIF-5